MRTPAHSLVELALARNLIWIMLGCALVAVGCANCRIPRIDPTGERLFVWGQPAASPALSTAPPFNPTLAPTAPVMTALRPRQPLAARRFRR